MNVRTGLAVVLVVAWAGAAMACGPYYPTGYLYTGREYAVLDMPRASFHAALEMAAGREVTQVPLPQEYPPGTPSRRTSEAENQDLEVALTATGFDESAIKDLVRQYQRMRAHIWRVASSQAQYHEDGHQVFYSAVLWGWQEGGPNNGWPGQWYRSQGEPGSIPATLDLAPYNDLLNRLPKEFSLYVQGAALYQTGKYDDAINRWKLLLELPAEQRHYRSIWAAFMIGKAYLQSDAEMALEYLAVTQALAAEGFADTLNLAPSSLGWMAFVEARTGRMAEAFHHYIEMWTTGGYPEQSIALTSLRFWASRLIREGEIDPVVAQDPLCANILMAYMTSSPLVHSPLAPLVAQLAQSDDASLEKWAGRVAWSEYRLGRFASAAEWANRALPECPYGKWTRAKLLLREGDIEEALALIRELLPAFPVADYPGEWGDDVYDTRAGNMVHGDLGVLHVSREEYVNALEAFMAGPYWLDAAYLAERVLTLKEVEKFIGAHEDDPRFHLETGLYASYRHGQTDSLLGLLKYLYGRRLFRAGEFEKGLRFFPETVLLWRSSSEEDPFYLRELAGDYVSHLQKGRDAAGAKRDRAAHLIEAARIARNRGLELMGSETEPDWRYMYAGSIWDAGATGRRLAADRKVPYGCPEVLWKQLLPKASERRRVEQHRIEPEKRFHYRYVAAELMWEASRLLPDNDPMTAQALYDAGTWLMDRDPEAADKYYKALVRRCRRLPIGQKADELRWFPREVTDADFEPLSHDQHGDT